MAAAANAPDHNLISDLQTTTERNVRAHVSSHREQNSTALLLRQIIATNWPDGPPGPLQPHVNTLTDQLARLEIQATSDEAEVRAIDTLKAEVKKVLPAPNFGPANIPEDIEALRLTISTITGTEGESKFMEVLEKLIRYSDTLQWTEENFRNGLTVTLTGEAYSYYSHIKTKPMADVLRLLQERFGTYQSSQSMIRKLDELVRKNGQNIYSFNAEVESLVEQTQKLFPVAEQPGRRALLLDAHILHNIAPKTRAIVGGIKARAQKWHKQVSYESILATIDDHENQYPYYREEVTDGAPLQLHASQMHGNQHVQHRRDSRDALTLARRSLSIEKTGRPHSSSGSIRDRVSLKQGSKDKLSSNRDYFHDQNRSRSPSPSNYRQPRFTPLAASTPIRMEVAASGNQSRPPPVYEQSRSPSRERAPTPLSYAEVASKPYQPRGRQPANAYQAYDPSVWRQYSHAPPMDKYNEHRAVTDGGYYPPSNYRVPYNQRQQQPQPSRWKPPYNHVARPIPQNGYNVEARTHISRFHNNRPQPQPQQQPQYSNLARSNSYGKGRNQNYSSNNRFQNAYSNSPRNNFSRPQTHHVTATLHLANNPNCNKPQCERRASHRASHCPLLDQFIQSYSAQPVRQIKSQYRAKN